MSNISGLSSIMSSMSTQSMQSRPDRDEKFKELDADSNGGLDKTELSALAKELSQVLGKTLNVDDSITTYDANNDGLLDQSEMDSMMKESMGPPPSSMANFDVQQALKAYQANSEEEDPLAALMEMLSKSTSSSSTASNAPNPDEIMKELDSDGSGGLNTSELDVMAENVSSMTGQTMDTENAISVYDVNKDGELSMAEMDAMMKALNGQA